MKLLNEVPDPFWGLFRSYNRLAYIDALLKINEEYQYNNYFLSWEVCVRVLGNYFSARRIAMQKEEQESDLDVLEPPATRVLKWLVQAGWLKKLEDFAGGVTNIVIPDYTAVFIELFEKLTDEQGSDTDIYIQNVYAILFSYRNDSRNDPKLLNTALVNTRELNRVLQNMLHNMDKFFTSLLDTEYYGDLLKEHLEGYVEEIVKKKYHILKTTDNFYQYKTDIKNWLKEIMEEENHKLLALEREGQDMDGTDPAPAAEQRRKDIHSVMERAAAVERGFRDIERRIYYMDREHMKYVRATVTRLNYLLNEDRDMKGLVVRLLNCVAAAPTQEEMDSRIRLTAARMNFSQLSLLSDRSLYKKRRFRAAFVEDLEADEEQAELSKENVLKLNQIQSRFSRKQIESFLEERFVDGKFEVDENTVMGTEDFEKLILAYDDSIRKDSKYKVVESAGGAVDSGKYRYPRMTFVKKMKNIPEEKPE